MKPNISLTVFILLFSVIGGCYSYRILGVFPLMTRSHSILGHALMKGLAEAGHNVTYVTPRPTGKSIPNYREVSTLSKTMENRKCKNFKIQISCFSTAPFYFPQL